MAKWFIKDLLEPTDSPFVCSVEANTPQEAVEKASEALVIATPDELRAYPDWPALKPSSQGNQKRTYWGRNPEGGAKKFGRRGSWKIR